MGLEKENLFEITHSEQRLLHGGREVLHLSLDMPQGSCRAAEHFAALTALFEGFAKQALLAEAAADCERCFAQGRGFAFHCHRATASLTVSRLRRGWRILFSASCEAAGSSLFHRYLLTFWDIGGNLQKPLPRRFGQERRASKQKNNAKILPEDDRILQNP